MGRSIRISEGAAIEPGGRKVVEVDGQFVAIFNVGGKHYAIQDICSHDSGPLAEGEMEGFEIKCPRHGGRFDIRTGEALSFPAIVPIQWYPIRIEGNDLILEME